MGGSFFLSFSSSCHEKIAHTETSICVFVSSEEKKRFDRFFSLDVEVERGTHRLRSRGYKAFSQAEGKKNTDSTASNSLLVALQNVRRIVN